MQVLTLYTYGSYTFGFDFSESADGLHLLSMASRGSSQTLVLLHSVRGGQERYGKCVLQGRASMPSPACGVGGLLRQKRS